jgi:16S rRNA A1518/A1519 N6-dimethyltransferase RsmA/KsgA/DIM1 with predicted DNA glycosylase/AP lyase activity
VDSACVCLVRRDPSLLAPQEKPAFTRIVKRAFSQRRKMMLKLLREDWLAKKLDQVFEELQLAAQTRAETVSLEQFARLTKLLMKDV